MQRIFTSFLLLLSLSTYAQTGIWKPFKLYILKPDTAEIDSSLLGEIATIESANLQEYYASLKQMEEMVDFKSYPEDMKASFEETQARYKKEIPLMKAQEDSVKKFKYFEIISQYSTEVYNFYFNEYAPFSTFVELPNQKTDLISIKKLADSSNADYIVFYNNIHTIIQRGLPVLKLTTSLYSKRDNKIILTKETEGDSTSKGDMWACEGTLSCLLSNSIRTSTDEVAKILIKRQIEKK